MTHSFVEIPRVGRRGGYDGVEDINAEL
jgi:hypothetical protein